jgi:hypothetical protein
MAVRKLNAALVPRVQGANPVSEGTAEFGVRSSRSTTLAWGFSVASRGGCLLSDQPGGVTRRGGAGDDGTIQHSRCGVAFAAPAPRAPGNAMSGWSVGESSGPCGALRV